MALLKDSHPFVAEILDGNHDEILDALAQAVKIRKARAIATSGIRPYARIRVTEAAADRAPELVGREGKVERINAKTVTIELDKLSETDFRTGWRVPSTWLEVVVKS